jgi:hypothetical protein
LDVWGVPLGRVHVTRLDQVSGGRTSDVCHHVGRLTQEDVGRRNGVPVVGATRAALETGLIASAESALVTFDSLLHRQLDDHDGLWQHFEAMAHWPSSLHLHIPVRMAEAGAESPGESRGRWLFHQGGVPAPEVQFPVSHRERGLIATTDWGWPSYGLLGEFDGRVKYGRLLQPGMEAGDAVFAEKRREDLIREVTGMRMIRLVWEDLQRPRATAARIHELLGRAA